MTRWPALIRGLIDTISVLGVRAALDEILRRAGVKRVSRIEGVPVCSSRCFRILRRLVKEGCSIRIVEDYAVFDCGIAVAAAPLSNGCIECSYLPALIELLDRNPYISAPVSYKGAYIVDVGCGAGETPSMFIRLGARRVLCIEPNPVAAQAASLVAKLVPGIEVVWAAVCHARGQTSVLHAGPASVTSRGRGIGVPCTTIDSIIARASYEAGDSPLILKMDCEGCEYNLLCASNLAQVDFIIIEAHGTPWVLLDKLSSAGFECTEKVLEKYTPPLRTSILYCRREKPLRFKR